MKAPHPYNDLWVYLAYVRDFLDSGQLALREPYFGEVTEVSRVQINGWLLQQAAFSRISGIDPVVLVLDYLTPTLILVALLAFYALARVLFESETAALSPARCTPCSSSLTWRPRSSPSAASSSAA